MVRTSMGGAVDTFNRALASMERDAKNWAKRMSAIMSSVSMPHFGTGMGTGAAGSPSTGFNSNQASALRQLGGGGAGSGIRPPTVNNNAMAAAQREMTKFYNERAKQENSHTQNVQRNAEAQHRTRAGIWQKTSQAFSSMMNRFKAQEAKTTQEVSSGGGILSGTFWGVLSGNIASRFVNAFIDLPKVASKYIGEAMDIASERQKAFASLGTVIGAQGGDLPKITEQVKNLRAVKLGLVDITDAVSAYRNLRLKLQLEDSQYIDILERTTDTMAFNKQATLSYGEAFRRTTEGIRLGISTLSDAGGVAENLVAIIESAGGKWEDLDDASKKAAASQKFLEGFMRVTAGSIGDADKLAVQYAGHLAMLTIAEKNFSAALGTIIIQNPDILAAIQTITAEIDKNTKALQDNETQTYKSADSWTSLFSKGLISAVNFIDGLTATVDDFMKIMGAGVVAFASFIELEAAAVIGYFNLMINGLNMLKNGIQALVSSVPGLVGLVGGAVVGAIPDIPTLQNDALESAKSLNRQAIRLWDSATSRGAAHERNAERWRMFEQFKADEYERKYSGGTQAEKDKFFQSGAYNKPVAAPPPASGAPDKDKDKAGKAATAAAKAVAGNAMVKFFQEIGAHVTDFKRAPGTKIKGTNRDSLHGYGMAVDTRTKGISDEELFRIAEEGLKGGYRLYDEREVKGVDPHFHWEKNARKSTFGRAALYGGQMQLDFLKKLDAERRAKTVEGKFEEFAALQGVGGRMAGAIQRGLDARPVTTAEGGAGLDMGVVTRSDMYISALKESLGLTKDKLGVSARMSALIAKDLAFQEEVNVLQEDYNMTLQEGLQAETVSFALAQRRLPLKEAELDYQKSITAQVTQASDIERDSETLRLQNADENFVRQRRINAVAAERYDYEKDISNLQDQIATGGANDGLRIQAEYLKTIVQLREREIEAVLTINRAQLEIANQTVFSATQANARVQDFLASQKNVSDTMGDFRVGLIETGYDLIDQGLDRIIPKMGILTQVVKDLLSSLIRMALSPVFQTLFGGGTGGQQGGGGQGGTGGGILSRLLGGFGGGSGAQQVGGGIPLFGGQNIFSGAAMAGTGGVQGTGGGGNPFAAFQSYAQRMSGTPATMGSSMSLSGIPSLAGGFGMNAGTPGGFVSGGGAGASPLTGQVGGGGIGGWFGNATNQMMIAGAVTGGMMGSQLGRGSGMGTVLGTVGGGLAGVLGAGLFAAGGSITTATGAAGMLAAFSPATFGITAAIAGVLMLTAFLMGRAARRKKEIKAVNTSAGDAMTKMRQLLEDVKNFKIDGASAVSQAEAIRDQFQEGIKDLKSKQAKTLAQGKLGEMNTLIGQIKSEGEKADRVKEFASITDERLVPTFAAGGFSSAGYGTGGGNRPYTAMLHPNEAVLNPQGIMAMGGYRRLQEAGVRGIGMSDNYERSYGNRGGGGGGGKQQDIYVIGVFDESTADDLVDKASVVGFAKKVKFVAKGDVEGVMTTIEKKLVSGF